jgi:prepilin-type N-terminal cleavage/methylation domain-containing protein
MTPLFRRVRSGFTLIELLVVVAIIALLIAILLPSLGKAKENARLSVCGSNLRQIYTALAIYAEINNQVIPVGYTFGDEQANYYMWKKTDPTTSPILLGALVSVNNNIGSVLTTGKIFFCPSQTSPSNMYDINSGNETTSNVWRLDPVVVATIGTAWETRAGYSCRPVVAWNGGPVLASPTTTRASRLTDFTPNQSLLADVISASNSLDLSHQTQINVAYANGSVRRAPKAAFATNLSKLPITFSSGANNFELNTSVTPNTGVWADLDNVR